MKTIKWGSNGEVHQGSKEEEKPKNPPRRRLRTKTKDEGKEGLKQGCEGSRSRVKRVLSREFFNDTHGRGFTEVAKTDRTEGNREAQATPPLLEAPQGVSKGENPLCSPLLVGVANLGTPPPVSRQTQVPPGSSKRRRLSTKQKEYAHFTNSQSNMSSNQGNHDWHVTSRSNARERDSRGSHEQTLVPSAVGRLQPTCTGET